MSSIQLAEFVLWRSLKQKREDEFSAQKLPLLVNSFSEDIAFPNEMICRVCTNPADVPITEKIDGILISSARRSVSSMWISSSDYPKYVCKTCLEELKVALDFKKICESSDNLFYQTLPKKAEGQSPTRTSMVTCDFAQIIHHMKDRRLACLKHANKNTLQQKKNPYHIQLSKN